MRLIEFADEYPKAVYDPADDKLDQRQLTNTRKNKITLRDLHKLKKLRAFQKLKELQRSDVISAIYGGDVDEEI